MPRRDESKIAENLRQTQSAKKRKYAIPQFTKALRRADRFQPAWDAIGGAPGLASTMAEFSIADLRELCKRLGRTASAPQVQPQRRAALDELVTILYEGQEDDRPLSRFYQDIVPGCSIELVQRFEKEKNIKWTLPQGRRMLLGHREQHEAKFLDEIFSESKHLTFYQQRRLFRGNIAFTEKILATLLLFPHDDKIHIPFDLMEEVVMPLLKRLCKSKYDDDTRNRYLDLVLRCVRRHETQLTPRLSLEQGGLLQYVVDRWGDAPKGSESKRKIEAYLVQTIELSTIAKMPYSFEGVRKTVCVSQRLSHEERYDFFRLLLLHTNQYQMDIESDSEQDIAQLKRFHRQAWPSNLFFYMDYKRSLRLFEKLDKLFPRSEFLAVGGRGGTILAQTQGHAKHSSFGDVEIVRALLIRKSKTQNEHPGWHERTRELINERRTNAQQSREAVERAYWAKSALHLCVAFGDLETLNDTVIWSRRFIAGPSTSSTLFREEVFKTREIEDLLGAIPDRDVGSPEAVVSFTATLVKKDIELANQILINIIEMVTVAMREPGFRPGDWTWIFHLVKSVADHRMGWLDVFFNNLTKCSKSDREKCERELMETIWKPTTDVLIQAGATVSYPTLGAMRGNSSFDTLMSESNGNSMKGIYVYQILSKTPLSAPLLAELARFLIDQMRVRLGSEAMKVQMKSIVSIVDGLAASDQPSLACPFIRDLVLGDEGAQESSSWHRHLLSLGFLSVLPAKAAKECLYTMASAMKEKMREQNQNTDSREKADITTGGTEEDASKETIKPQGPSIKITTVKMLAQLLQHNLFMAPSSSCDILTGLLAEARHIDIRITITNSLFAVMEDPTCPSALRKRILDAIEEYIVPAVAQLNERRGLTESDWAEAAANNASLPSVGEETPLYQLLTLKLLHGNLNEEDKARLAQLIMGSLEQSAANNARWMKLFMAKNNFSLDEDEELPHLPVHIKLFPELFRRHMHYIPTSVFNMIRPACFINIDPSPGIKRITRTIREDRDLVNSKAGKHWLSQFGENGHDSLKFGVLQATQTLHKRPSAWNSKLAENGITVQMLQSFVIEFAEKLLKIGQPEILNKLVERLRSGYLQDRETWNYWHENGIPTIKQIISKTEELQLRINNKEAEPRLLPSVFQLSLSTLPTPIADSTAAEQDFYVREVYKFVIELADRQSRPYHVDFEKLKEEFNGWSSDRPLARCALRLAEVQAYDLKLAQQPTLTDYLCWELVEHMLAKAYDPKDDHVAKAVAQLVRDWVNCEDGAMSAMGTMFKKKSQYRKDRFWDQEE
ncbi:hypothetical protein BKA59DRAFT_486581 [Fusarium tricinctum]|uniref:Uncharacterized protein n=1 Tax=Fusarium tricinctum TaxID=61284 RepID=A0A8K0RS55_9HYPO|nr:hypothetical protein BKA59DRAFT_486581 [Fusarium tricinctum]